MREYTGMHLIKHVINCYEILSLSSNDGKWVVAVGTDLTTPTQKWLKFQLDRLNQKHQKN
ncbi:hypothetical protein [Streptococcus thermophilus]|uniref:hypothetical protein n=1 Tax=Streptococcus thermophilus TaxID=1308 RepID=UPI001E60685D|nr:hypothetical protein [Streptococcus thermophilus]